MKSTQEELEKRGWGIEAEKEKFLSMPKEKLLEYLKGENQNYRTLAVEGLAPRVNEVADELIAQLVREKCLYTRIAIATTLQKGSKDTVKKMILKLGCIGKNQLIDVPGSVSKKKSYPLPRDILARSLAKMNPSNLDIMIEELHTENEKIVLELLDAIGWMIFYHSELATENRFKQLLELYDAHQNCELYRYKMIEVFSGFSLKECQDFLNALSQEEGIFAKQAKRSLDLTRKKQ